MSIVKLLFRLLTMRYSLYESSPFFLAPKMLDRFSCRRSFAVTSWGNWNLWWLVLETSPKNNLEYFRKRARHPRRTLHLTRKSIWVHPFPSIRCNWLCWGWKKDCRESVAHGSHKLAFRSTEKVALESQSGSRVIITEQERKLLKGGNFLENYKNIF